MLTRVSRKLLLASSPALACIGIVAVVTLGELRAWDEAAGRLTRESQIAVFDGIFHSAVTRATGEALSFGVTGKTEFSKEAADALLHAEGAMAQLRRLSGPSEASFQQDDIRALRQRQEEILALTRAHVNETLRARGRAAGLGEQLELLYSTEPEVDRTWRDLLVWHAAERKAIANTLRLHRSRLHGLVAAMMLAGVLWALGLMVFVTRTITSPLNRLSRAAQRVADGDLEHGVTISSRDEIGTLQSNFNRMVHDLRTQQSMLTERAQAMAHRMESLSAQPGRTEQRPTADSALSGKLVLLVEPDPIYRETTKAMLQQCGVRVAVADTGRDALAAIGRGRFDLILMECQMPSKDWFETTQRIRTGAGAQARIPIIAMTDDSTTQHRERRLAAGMDDGLTKPFSYFELHALLMRWLPPQRDTEPSDR